MFTYNTTPTSRNKLGRLRYELPSAATADMNTISWYYVTEHCGDIEHRQYDNTDIYFVFGACFCPTGDMQDALNFLTGFYGNEPQLIGVTSDTPWIFEYAAPSVGNGRCVEAFGECDTERQLEIGFPPPLQHNHDRCIVNVV